MERFAILLANIVHGANIRMVQGRSRLRFQLKPRERLRIARHLRRQKLEGDKAMQPQVLGFIHHAHTSAAQLLHDSIM